MNHFFRFGNPSSRHWLPLLPALAMLLLLGAVVWGNETLVSRELEHRAFLRVAQSASNHADDVGRVLSRRGTELSLLGQLAVVQASLPDAAIELQVSRLAKESAAYLWIGLIEPSGRVRLSSDGRLGGSLLPASRWPLASHQMPWFGKMQALWGTLPQAPDSMDANDWLGALAVPVKNGQGEPIAHLVAVMSRQYFEWRRQFELGEPGVRRQLELSLGTYDGSSLLGEHPSVDAAEWQRLRERPTRSAIELKDANGEIWLLSVAPLAPDNSPLSTDSPLNTDWLVAASQPLTAATAPADALRSGLMVWGLGATLLIGAGGMWLARRMTRPYEEVLDAVARQSGEPLVNTPGAYLEAVSVALQRLAPAWKDDNGQQALLGRVLHDARRLQSVLEHLPTPVYLLDARQRVLFWNRQAQHVFGWRSDEAVGRPIGELIPGDVHASAPRSSDDAPQAFEALTADRQGHPIWCEWRLLSLNSNDEDAQGQVVMARDISDRVRAATAMVEHQIELSDLNHRLLEQEQTNNRRMAQTLHDQLGQTLGAMRLTYDAMAPLCMETLSPRLVQRAQSLGAMIDTAVKEVRKALVELRPPLLEEQGLAVALDNEVRMQQPAMEPAKLQFELISAQESPRWPADVEYATFMIAREALGNAMRHAQAHRVRVQLEGDGTWLRLTVRDDGSGLPWPTASRPGHLGLVGMRERALAIGARLAFLPATPSGLEIQLQWPTPQTVDAEQIDKEEPA